jgi:membrane-bound lytic murein transglycosylase A
MRYIILQAFLFLLILSCAHRPTKEAHVDFFHDDLGFKNLQSALVKNIRQLEASPIEKLKIANIDVDKKKYVLNLRMLSQFLETQNDKVLINKLIQKLFKVVEMKSDRPDGEILLTSYYSPLLKGSLIKTKVFSMPLYKKPINNLNFNREEINMKKPFEGQKLELCYLDPIDAFFLHVQGSGTIEFETGEQLNVVFDGNNGRPYSSLGKLLSQKGILEKDKVTLESLENYLRSLNEEELQKTLNLNESYVFFKGSDQKSLTTLGNVAVAGRTIATDGDLFSKGLLAYMEFDKPTKLESGNIEFTPTTRFVLDQDTGSAIKGSGRIDLFWGEGEVAKSHAGVMKGKAHLYFLVPRD